MFVYKLPDLSKTHASVYKHACTHPSTTPLFVEKIDVADSYSYLQSIKKKE